MDDIIKEIYKTNSAIHEMENFLWLLEKSDVDSDYGTKTRPCRNEFSEMSISSYIWTGSQNPKYSKRIESIEVMNELSNVMKPILKMKIEEKKLRLSELIKS